MVSPPKPGQLSTPTAEIPQAINKALDTPGDDNPAKSSSISVVELPKLGGVSVCRGSDGHAYILIVEGNNARVLRIGGKQANLFLLRLGHESGRHLKANDIRDLNDQLTAYAELKGHSCDVWYRVAPYQGGVELDLGDNAHTRIRVTPGKVDVVTEGSETFFYRTPGMLPFVMPTVMGDLDLLDKYLNLHPAEIVLLKAWLCYTLLHPKVPTANFIFLVLLGDQGSGKSTLCRLIQFLIDPNVIGVQTFPRNIKDFVIAGQNAHVLFFDNMRVIKAIMADILCIASTGGATTTRQLYTDAEQHIHRLHVALVLNGIHNIIDQPDLAQRCLPLHLQSLGETDRQSESEFMRDFQADLPAIFRGLLDLSAKILQQLPSVQVTNPERMVDFVRVLAAMEKVDDVPAGIYQAEYSDVLNRSMLESLQENPLAAAMLSFVADEVEDSWTDTPSELLYKLNCYVGHRAQYSQEWPQNPTALSIRLKSLRVALRRQGIRLEFTRGKKRQITVTRMEGFCHE